MIEVFKHYSKCNKLINERMIGAIETANMNAYEFQVDAFYKSIGEILDHIYKVDLMWMASFNTVREFIILKNPLLENPPKYNDRLFGDIGDFKNGRDHLDNLFIELADEITENDLLQTVSRTNRLGKKLEKPFWKALMHLFNHQTHHRGQISQILDQLKIENDYSNMIGID
jgi:uncharacterized damage-inducible protein DinB